MPEVFSPELRRLVHEVFATGRYASEDDLLIEAVRLLSERTRRLEDLRQQLQIGRDQLECDQYTDYDDVSLRVFFDELQQRGRDRYEKSSKQQ